MLRTSSAANAPYYAVYVTPNNGLVVQDRASAGAAAVQPASLTGTVPMYLKVARSGTTFSAYTSTNGSTWTLIPGSSVRLSGLAGTVLAGWSMRISPPSRVAGMGSFASRNHRDAMTGCTPFAIAHCLKFTIALHHLLWSNSRYLSGWLSLLLG